ncbi:MAG TPA: preprotein translocase subunit YajC [Actinomycetes bacterium]|nr:preprotein translocase subunit YajC [Actinomycetes bacterium]
MPNAAPNLILFVLLFGALYFLLIRPQRRRFEAQRQMQASLQLGDEITTSGGLVGTIRRLDPDVLTVELSPGVEARVKRQFVIGRHNPMEAEPLTGEDDEEREQP